MARLTFLGTGTSQGVPMVACPCSVCHSTDPRDRRLRSSVLVSDDVTNVAIDAGPDFRYQMLRAEVTHLEAILLTHEHKDHTGGIDDVRAFNYFQQSATDIYATERVQRAVRKDFDYAFAEKRYPGVPEIRLHDISDDEIRIGGLTFRPIHGLHYRLPVVGFRCGTAAYLTDFNHIDDCEVEKLRGVETLIVNALRWEKHISHFTVDEAIELSRRVAPRRTLLTHCSHQIGLYADIAPRLPQGVELAYDNLSIEI
ncbi:MAG: MBL fold metallo-hydrolase [Rikenellaceae bacterium]|nr:MBL fold metallo-hydrolase [Rikenellaceae bacterium]